MTESLRQAANDAALDAEAWKQTAARWRKRAIREGAPWRRRCAKLEARVDDANEKAANLQERVDELEEELRDAKAPLEARIDDLDAALSAERSCGRRAADELATMKNRMKSAGSLEALIVERDTLDELNKALKAKVGEAERRAEVANSRAWVAEQGRRDGDEKIMREKLMPSKARLRVIATRLGIGIGWSGYSDDEKLTAEIDRLILQLQEKATAVARSLDFDCGA